MGNTINMKAKTEAEEYIKEKLKGDAKKLDIKDLHLPGFRGKSPSKMALLKENSLSTGREASSKAKSPQRKSPPNSKKTHSVPDLVRSSSDDSGTSSDDDSDNYGPRKNPNEKK